MSTLSELLPSGGGGSTVDFVASGTLPNGKAVVLKSDGTVEVVGESSTAVAKSIPAGSEVQFLAATSDQMTIVFDPNTANKFVIAYRSQASSPFDGTAIVGTVSGTSLSFGTSVVFNSGNTPSIGIAFDPNTAGKFVIAYANGTNSNFGTAKVGTLSGTSLSFGSAVVFNSTGYTDYNFVDFDPNSSGKFIVSYHDQNATGDGRAIVGTISGTSITFGSEAIFESGYGFGMSSSFDPNTANKFVIAYMDFYATPARSGKVVVGTISGTSVSFGTPVVINANTTNAMSVSFDPNTAGKFVVVYRDDTNSYSGTSKIGTMSGTSSSFGTAVVYNSTTSSWNKVAFDPNSSGKFIVSYSDGGDSLYGKVVVGTRSGTSSSFDTATTYSTADSYNNTMAIDPNAAGKFVAAWRSGQSPYYSFAVVGQIAATVITTNLTTTNFVGTSTAAYTNGQTATIAVQGGLSTNQTGLTIGSTYFVQPTGTLATTAGTPSVNAGKALSATTLLLKDL